MLRRRLALCCLLLAALGGLLVHDTATFDEHTEYPTIEELDANYDSYLGEKAVLTGRVVSADPANATVAISLRRSTTVGAMRVTGFDRSVDRGGSIHVYGTLKADHTIAAENVVVVNTSARSELYKYAASAVGAVLILGGFFREWRFDRETLLIEERKDG